MALQVVAEPTRDDGNVRFRLRHSVERYGLLFAKVVATTEGLFQRNANEPDDDGVAISLRLTRDEQAVEQLDLVVLAEDAGIDHTVVTRTAQSPEG
jgi:hypothetical protein